MFKVKGTTEGCHQVGRSVQPPGTKGGGGSFSKASNIRSSGAQRGGVQVGALPGGPWGSFGRLLAQETLMEGADQQGVLCSGRPRGGLCLRLLRCPSRRCSLICIPAPTTDLLPSVSKQKAIRTESPDCPPEATYLHISCGYFIVYLPSGRLGVRAPGLGKSPAPGVRGAYFRLWL